MLNWVSNCSNKILFLLYLAQLFPSRAKEREKKTSSDVYDAENEEKSSSESTSDVKFLIDWSSPWNTHRERRWSPAEWKTKVASRKWMTIEKIERIRFRLEHHDESVSLSLSLIVTLPISTHVCRCCLQGSWRRWTRQIFFIRDFLILFEKRNVFLFRLIYQWEKKRKWRAVIIFFSQDSFLFSLRRNFQFLSLVMSFTASVDARSTNKNDDV